MKEYSLNLVNRETGEIIYEEELILTRTPHTGVFIENLIHTIFAQFETEIDKHESN